MEGIVSAVHLAKIASKARSDTNDKVLKNSEADINSSSNDVDTVMVGKWTDSLRAEMLGTVFSTEWVVE